MKTEIDTTAPIKTLGKYSLDIARALAPLVGAEVKESKYHLRNPGEITTDWHTKGIRIMAGGMNHLLRDAHLAIILKPDTTVGEAVDRILALLKKAAKEHEEILAAEKIKEETRKREKEKKAADIEDWKNKLRVARGGKPGETLPDELAFRMIGAAQLLEARTGPHTIRVPLPIDMDRRAAFLAKLDAFLAENL